jgi:hypothetical protein
VFSFEFVEFRLRARGTQEEKDRLSDLLNRGIRPNRSSRFMDRCESVHACSAAQGCHQ